MFDINNHFDIKRLKYRVIKSTLLYFCKVYVAINQSINSYIINFTCCIRQSMKIISFFYYLEYTSIFIYIFLYLSPVMCLNIYYFFRIYDGHLVPLVRFVRAISIPSREYKKDRRTRVFSNFVSVFNTRPFLFRFSHVQLDEGRQFVSAYSCT